MPSLTITLAQARGATLGSGKPPARWLVADGRGGYAMGTVSGLRTRRYHGHAGRGRWHPGPPDDSHCLARRGTHPARRGHRGPGYP